MGRWRDYRLIVELGIAPSEIDDMNGQRADWLLAIHDEHLKLQSERQSG